MEQTLNYPKSWYQVFECSDANDLWSYDETKLLFAHDSLAHAHTFAWEKWNQDQTKMFTIIQPYDGSCRGGYGFPEDETEDPPEQVKATTLRDLAISGGIYDCICDPYDKLRDGDNYSSVMVDLIRYAHKVIDLCAAQCEPRAGLKYSPNTGSAMAQCRADILALKEIK